MVTHVDVRAVIGLVLALQAVRDLRGKASEGLVARIDDEPVAADTAGLGKYSLHRLQGSKQGVPGPKRPGSVLQAARAMQSKLWGRRWAAGLPPMPLIMSARMESGHPLDLCIGAADRALRSVFAPAQASRPVPGQADEPPGERSQLSEAERRQAAALMRVNHAGEIAAQALYHGQALVARSEATRQLLLKAAREESDH